MALKSCAIKSDLSVRPIYHPTFLCGDFNCSPDSKLYEFITKGKLVDFNLLNRNIFSGQTSYTNSSIPIQCPLLPLEMNINDQCQFGHLVDKRIKKLICEKSDVFSQQTFSSGTLSHSFNFKSVYSHVDKRRIEEVTTCLPDTRRTVDYIFYHNESGETEESEAEEGELDSEESQGSDDEQEGRVKETQNSVAKTSRSKTQPDLQLLARLELFNVQQLKYVCLPEKNYSSDHFLIAAKFFLQ